jgi:hypothetical protein
MFHLPDGCVHTDVNGVVSIKYDFREPVFKRSILSVGGEQGSVEIATGIELRVNVINWRVVGGSVFFTELNRFFRVTFLQFLILAFF